MNLRENTKEEALIKKRKSPENDSEASPKRKLMMAQGTKTPITILQEICAKTVRFVKFNVNIAKSCENRLFSRIPEETCQFTQNLRKLQTNMKIRTSSSSSNAKH